MHTAWVRRQRCCRRAGRAIVRKRRACDLLRLFRNFKFGLGEEANVRLKHFNAIIFQFASGIKSAEEPTPE